MFTITAGAIEGDAVLILVPTEELGRSLVDSHIISVKSAFKETHAPYAGHITEMIDCEARKFVGERAVTWNGIETKLISAVATDRRIFGNCSIDQVKFAAVAWAGYDPKRKQVLALRLFKPVQDANSVEESQRELTQVVLTISGNRLEN